VADLFVSYTHEDRPVAAAIAQQFLTLGVDVWWDHELLGGDDYRGRISELLARVPAAIVIWSRRSVQSHWVLNEAAAASERRCLIPIAIDDEKPPIDFRSLHTIDLKSWLPGDALPTELVRAVAGRLGRTLDYEPNAARPNIVGRIGQQATAAWYLDFESLLFFLIGHGLACMLMNLPISRLAEKLATAGSQIPWAPYVVALSNGLIIAALYMRPVLESRRLPVAAPIFLAASALSVLAYEVDKAITGVLSSDEVLILVGMTTFAFILVSAIADRAVRRH
jgi:hypothetical protein